MMIDTDSDSDDDDFMALMGAAVWLAGCVACRLAVKTVADK
jgi:hypothetical protein